MNFKFHKIGQNTEISHDLLYSMARNDDIVKNYYEASGVGILGWYETESSVLVNAFDPDAEVSGQEDPEWENVASLIIYPEEERVVRLTVRGLKVTQQAPSDAPSGVNIPYRHALNARFSIQYPDPTNAAKTIAVMPYRFVASGRYVAPNKIGDFGRIFGHNICIATNNYNLPADDALRLSKYKNIPLIKPGKTTLNFEIKKIDVNQNIVANGESSFQIMVQDVGGWT